MNSRLYLSACVLVNQRPIQGIHHVAKRNLEPLNGSRN